MIKKILTMDVGGTHTRARIVELREQFETCPSIITTRIANLTSKQEFLEFTREFIKTAGSSNTPDLAVLCFAGPVIAHTVSMTNWSSPTELNMKELVHTGLDEHRIILLNDMEAAGYGLIAYKLGVIGADAVPLYTGSKSGAAPHGNSILLIPGTGIGLAGLVAGTALEHAVPVACEMQHTAITSLDPHDAKIAELLSRKLGKPRLCWEDFISGRGLVNIYECLVTLRTQGEAIGLTAADIAEHAVQKSDLVCGEALSLYYRCVGALAQILALTFQAYGGIYLAGNSTRKNLGFIQNSPFLAELHNNHLRTDLLKLFPVYLLPRDLSLEGARYVASRYYKQ